MPSIDGGSSSDRSYAPHMYILTEGGDPTLDADYAFVGDAAASAHNWSTGEAYRIGVTPLGDIVCEHSVIDKFKACEVPTGIPFSAVPESIKRVLIEESLPQIATTAGHIMLGVLGVEVPKDVEPLDFNKLFDGSAEERASEMDKSERWDDIEQQLRAKLID